MQTRTFAVYCTVALLAISIPAASGAQIPAVQLAEGDTEFTVFAGGKVAGREQVRVSRSGSTWIISSTGSIGTEAGGATTRFEARYTSDLHPIESRVEMIQGEKSLVVATSYGGTTAINEVTQNGTTTAKNDQISARTIVLPNNFYAAYQVLAARLPSLEAGAQLAAYVAPQAEVQLTVKGMTPGRLDGPSGEIATRRYDVAFQNPGGALEAQITIDDRARLVRLEIPAAGLAVVRSELATVATRATPVRNPTDVDVTIPGNGFNIAATITTPAATGRLRLPAVVLVAGSGPVDRDETVAGIPIFAQLAGALAEQGFLVLRYDKRGVGQSGGRIERVTLEDYARDLIAVVKWLEKRDNVDKRRLAVVGHSEGGAVAMLAAAREDKIKSLVLVSAPGTTGAELILEQQRHLLGTMNTPEAERQEKIELQKRIQAAVISGKWDGIDESMRKQADSTWFRSLLLFDPAKIMSDIEQPILIVQPDLDRQVASHHGEKLAALARGRDDSPPVELVHLSGINHLLVKATTGEVSEYATLTEKTISPEVVTTIADWLRK